MNTKPSRGLKSYYPTDKGPIDTYQLGHDGRVEFIGAEIGVDHLKKGNSCQVNMLQYILTGFFDES